MYICAPVSKWSREKMTDISWTSFEACCESVTVKNSTKPSHSLQLNGVSPPELSPMQGGSLCPGCQPSPPSPPLPPPLLRPPTLPFPPHFASTHPYPHPSSRVPSICTGRRLNGTFFPAHHSPSLADYQPASGTWAGPPRRVSPTSQGGLGALTKERPSHMNNSHVFYNYTTCLKLKWWNVVLHLYHVAWSLLALPLLTRAVRRLRRHLACTSGLPVKVRVLTFLN